jgi:sporulation protein YlmC with PRC-barrel domain
MPATRTAEGTAADSTQPGETPVRGTAASRAPDAATSRVATAEGATQGARRGSTMIGAVVKDSQGQRAGTVQDIIIDPKSGRITHAVIAQSSQSESLVLIPWRTVESMHRGGAMVVDRDRLASAPKFQSSQWPDFKRADWSQQADQYWQPNMTGTAETMQREAGTRQQ